MNGMVALRYARRSKIFLFVPRIPCTNEVIASSTAAAASPLRSLEERCIASGI